MTTRYFHSSTPMRDYGDGVEFEPYGIFGGSLFGIFQTDDAATLSKLDGLIADPKTGVSEMTAAQYASAVEKKTVFSQASSPLTPRQVQPKVGPIKGSGVVRVEAGPEPDSKVFEAASPDDVVVVAKVDDSTARSPGRKKKVTADERATTNVE